MDVEACEGKALVNMTPAKEKFLKPQNTIATTSRMKPTKIGQLNCFVYDQNELEYIYNAVFPFQKENNITTFKHRDIFGCSGEPKCIAYMFSLVAKVLEKYHKKPIVSLLFIVTNETTPSPEVLGRIASATGTRLCVREDIHTSQYNCKCVEVTGYPELVYFSIVNLLQILGDLSPQKLARPLGEIYQYDVTLRCRINDSVIMNEIVYVLDFLFLQGKMYINSSENNVICMVGSPNGIAKCFSMFISCIARLTKKEIFTTFVYIYAAFYSTVKEAIPSIAELTGAKLHFKPNEPHVLSITGDRLCIHYAVLKVTQVMKDIY